MKHDFYLDENGDIDDFFLDYDIHNGPGCQRCHDGWCRWCHPERKDEECPGAAAIVLKKVRQTCYACPSQWDAWDAEGNYYYLRFRGGVGSIDHYPSPDDETWSESNRVHLGSFTTDNPLDGCITLQDFCKEMGIALDPDWRYV